MAADKPSTTEERRRLQLDFSTAAFDRLRSITEKAGARSNAEVVRNALRLYEWYLDQKKDGYSLQLVKGDTVKAVEIFF